MEIDFGGKVGILADFKPGTFFVARDNERTTIGMAAAYGNDSMAVLINRAVNPTDPFPSLVMGQHLGGMALIGLMSAYLVPSISKPALEFSSAQQDGPGSLILTEDKMLMRVARRTEGFYYLDVSTGSITPNRPSGIEIPRWSMRLPEKVGSALTLFEFDGPRPMP